MNTENSELWTSYFSFTFNLGLQLQWGDFTEVYMTYQDKCIFMIAQSISLHYLLTGARPASTALICKAKNFE